MEGGRDGSSRWDSGEQDGGKERTRTRLRKRTEERREENGAMISLLKRLLEFRGGEEIKEVIEHGERNQPARGPGETRVKKRDFNGKQSKRKGICKCHHQKNKSHAALEEQHSQSNINISRLQLCAEQLLLAFIAE